MKLISIKDRTPEKDLLYKCLIRDEKLGTPSHYDYCMYTQKTGKFETHTTAGWVIVNVTHWQEESAKEDKMRPFIEFLKDDPRNIVILVLSILLIALAIFIYPHTSL